MQSSIQLCIGNGQIHPEVPLSPRGVSAGLYGPRVECIPFRFLCKKGYFWGLYVSPSICIPLIFSRCCILNSVSFRCILFPPLWM